MAAMVLVGYAKALSLVEAILAMHDAGRMQRPERHCTLGGLGKTKTSLDIRRRWS